MDMDSKATLEKEYSVLQDIQNDYSKAVANRQQLESQLKENDMVLQEIKRIPEDATANVFKLVGPVLVKQERTEAQQNVEKRLEFIRGEIKRVEKQLAEMTAKENAKRLEVLALQQKIQQTAAGVAGAQEASA